MMNLVAICLVVTSLAAAGVWSPSPTVLLHPHQTDDNVIVKDGHRVVVVEYDQDDHPNTKISISPDTGSGSTSKEAAYLSRDNLKEASSSDVGRESLSSSEEKRKSGPSSGFAAKELICDAYGKCKHVISSTLGKARDEASARIHEIEREAAGAKEFVSHKAHDAKERAKEKFEGVAQEAREAKDSVSQKAHDAEGCIEEQIGHAKDVAKEAKEDAKTMMGETVRSMSEKGGEAKETAKGRSKAGANKVKEVGRKVLANYLQMLTPTSLMGLVNLLGFVTAYGMCTWVTFISSYVLAKALPRQQFALVQSKIYPAYFRSLAYSVGAALLGHLMSQRQRLFSNTPEMLQACNLFASLLMISFNMLYLEPRATKVMFERIKLEKEEGRGRELFCGEVGHEQTKEARPTEESPASAAGAVATAGATATTTTADGAEEAALRSRVAKLSERLNTLNSYSSLLNILTLMALSWHLVYLSQRLSQTC